MRTDELNINAELQEEIARRQRSEEELRRTVASLDKVVAGLALPTRDRPETDEAFVVSRFSLTDMMSCAGVIRGLSVGQQDVRQLAETVVRFLYDHFRDDEGNRAFALVRMFETRPFSQLDGDLQAVAAKFPEVGPRTACLVLQATAGDDFRWNDPKLSSGHRVIPLVSAEAVENLPMVSQLLRELGLDAAGVVTPAEDVVLRGGLTGVFHVAEARGSRWVPAQESFVTPRGIRSVVGFGDVLPDGRLFVVIAFSKTPISREIARLLSHLSLSLKMALQPLIDSPRRTEAQILALDTLLRNYETVVAAQEAALRRQTDALTRSNAELERFAYIASHDLQEPLRKVQAFGDLLVSKSGATLDDEGRLYVERMQHGVRRMQELINDLLAFARVTSQAKSFVEVDLSRVAQEVVSDMEGRMKTTNGIVEIGELPRLEGEPTQMRQLLQNLIGNALKFHRPDVPPVVVLRSRPLRSGNGPLKERFPAGPACEISVEDNGIGFEERYLDRIFAPFQRLHSRAQYEGTGMGLAICRKIVEQHGGTITARSAPGNGSTFVVTLPLKQPKGERPHAEF